jgi:acetyl-CoA C-acetyltransferase
LKRHEQEPVLDPRTPVLVGLHQLAQRVDDPLAGREPLELMLEAVEGAARDAGSKALLERADVVCVIRGRWFYGDPARVLAERIGATGAQSAGTPWGGNVVQSVLNRFADEIARGDRDVVVLAGAENGRSLSRVRKRGAKLAYSNAPGEADLSTGPELAMVHEAELARQVFHPLTMYPIFENALRYARGETIPQHRERIARLWARFNAVAVANPHAWIREPMTAERIGTPSPSNRMLGFPYTLLMNSNDKVDMAAALILCSLETSRRLGVPRDRQIFPHAGTDAHDHLFVSNRADLHSSPAIRIAGRRALELAGTSPEALDHVDLYSCFPSAVQVAANELGLSQERPLTVTGGLTFGGGPLNDYVLHSIARMGEVLRAAPGSVGLCSANGGFLTKHAFGVYSTEPPARGFRHETCQSEVDALPRREAVVDHDGAATLESYTVMFGGDGPQIAHTACLLPDGRRTWANSRDRDLALEMTCEEFCGRAVRIDGRGTFTLA